MMVAAAIRAAGEGISANVLRNNIVSGPSCCRNIMGNEGYLGVLNPSISVPGDIEKLNRYLGSVGAAKRELRDPS